MVTISVIDYGAGNLASVMKALSAVGAAPDRVTSPDRIEGALGMVIPGVGHFGATAAIDDRWRRAIVARLDAGAALLGICLGMQWLFDGSDEAPGVCGLGVFGGRCVRLTGPVKVPHVGWNTLAPSGARNRDAGLLAGLAPDASVYFTHTYAAPVTADSVTVTTHGIPFASVVRRGRIMGAQFHPEKSGAAGLRLLSNFVAIAGERG